MVKHGQILSKSIFYSFQSISISYMLTLFAFIFLPIFLFFLIKSQKSTKLFLQKSYFFKEIFKMFALCSSAFIFVKQ